MSTELRDEILSHLIEGQRVGIIAPNLETSRALFMQVLGQFRAEGIEAVHTTVRGQGRNVLELPNGAVLRTISTAPGAIRGLTLDAVVVIDEAAPSDVVAPALAGGQLGQIITATTPTE